MNLIFDNIIFGSCSFGCQRIEIVVFDPFPDGNLNPNGVEGMIILALVLGAVFIDRMRKRKELMKRTSLR